MTQGEAEDLQRTLGRMETTLKFNRDSLVSMATTQTAQGATLARLEPVILDNSKRISGLHAQVNGNSKGLGAVSQTWRTIAVIGGILAALAGAFVGIMQVVR